ncbi:MAG TPA: RNA 2',3'-cyclic phosphodiesterase [Ktedonobacteraceae bacterium]|jgi:2'-5' RNA ligase|nr:RNA 2',3'-cyclic phosphodiesterase [Ktedonobacteraceae bacterium]
MTRTFIALEMNEALQRHLDGVIRQVARALPAIRWVDPAGIHLTLAFLGELTDGELGGVKHAVAAAAKQAQPFSYRLSRLGTFGSTRQPRVVWMGIEESSGALQRVHHVLNRELTNRGFAVDKRPFSPHLTLARIKAPLQPEALQQLQQLISGPQHGLVSSTSYHVQHIDVMKSELQPSGACYSCLQAYEL